MTCRHDFEWVTFAMMPMFPFHDLLSAGRPPPRAALLGRAANLTTVGLASLTAVSRRLGKLLLS